MSWNVSLLQTFSASEQLQTVPPTRLNSDYN